MTSPQEAETIRIANHKADQAKADASYAARRKAAGLPPVTIPYVLMEPSDIRRCDCCEQNFTKINPEMGKCKKCGDKMCEDCHTGSQVCRMCWENV